MPAEREHDSYRLFSGFQLPELLFPSLFEKIIWKEERISFLEPVEGNFVFPSFRAPSNPGMAALQDLEAGLAWPGTTDPVVI